MEYGIKPDLRSPAIVVNIGCTGLPGCFGNIQKANELNLSHRLPVTHYGHVTPHVTLLPCGSGYLTKGFGGPKSPFLGVGNREVSRPLTIMQIQPTDTRMNPTTLGNTYGKPYDFTRTNLIVNGIGESSVPTVSDVPLSQSVKDCRTFLHPRTPFKLASFNVRTLRQIGQQAALASTMESLAIDVCCLSETRLYDSSSTLRLTSPAPSSKAVYHLRCSGDSAASASGTAGVGIALSHRAGAALLDWIPINSRLCAVRLSGSFKANRSRETKRCLFVVSAYAPTDCSSDTTKDEFYTNLNDLIKNAPKKDVIVLAGDFNARIGRLTPQESQLGGPYGLEAVRNDNGERFLNLCSDHRLFLASLNFRHRKRHLATWRPPSAAQSWTQIDHVAISYRWRGSVQDCRSIWSTSVDSDHALVCARFCLRFCGQRRTRPTRIDVTNLRQIGVRDTFQSKLATEFDHLAPLDIEQQWECIKNTMKRVSTEVCGLSKRQNKPWISANSLQLIEVRRTIPAGHSHNQQRQEVKRQLSKSLKEDRERWWKSRAEEMELASANGDSHKLFHLIRSVSSRRTCVSETIHELDGTLITNLDRRSDRWMEHFRDQFNWPAPPTLTTQTEEVTPWSVSTNPPTTQEVCEAVLSLKNHKSPGDDELPAELFKAGGTPLIEQLTNLLGEIWQQETVPTCWSRSIIVPIFKRGSRTDCSNHRGISLISIASKILVTIIIRRLSKTRELSSREEQAGFRSGRGCVDQIFTLRQLLEHRHSYERSTIIVFLDIRAAFDSVNRTLLWNYLISRGIPAKLVNILRALYMDTSGRVRVYNQLSQPFPITSGVRQGCPISPFLFNFVIDDVMQTALSNINGGGIELLPGSRVQGLDYADDIILLGNDSNIVQATLNNLTTEVNRYGMMFSPSKCKVLVQDWAGPAIVLSLAGENLEVVDRFAYLGSLITANGAIAVEIASRITKARLAFRNLQHLWRRSDISLSLKGRVYNASVRSVLLYGCESWPLRAEDVKRLSVFDHRCLRSISRVWWQQRVSNLEIRQRVFHGRKAMELKELIDLHRLRWLGHVLRMAPERLPRRALFVLPEENWKKRKGGQKTTWRRNMKILTASLSSVGASRLPGWGPKDKDCLWLETLAVMSQNRTQWRTCTNFLVS